MTAIIDYDAGNLKSVEKALAALGETPVISRDPQTLKEADRVILPGVGSFGDAMGKLTQYGLVPVIHEIAASGRPFLGICLGLQLMYEGSEESPDVRGLGLLSGRIRKLSPGAGRKIPHMGWNSLEISADSRLFLGIPSGSFVYFVHSYFLPAREGQTGAVAEYGDLIQAAVEKGNLFACQFHPEKSSRIGRQILKNFLEI